jgi:hypothetical protein
MTIVLWVIAAVWGVSFAFVMAGFFVDTVRTTVITHRRTRRGAQLSV